MSCDKHVYFPFGLTRIFIWRPEFIMSLFSLSIRRHWLSTSMESLPVKEEEEEPEKRNDSKLRRHSCDVTAETVFSREAEGRFIHLLHLLHPSVSVSQVSWSTVASSKKTSIWVNLWNINVLEGEEEKVTKAKQQRQSEQPSSLLQRGDVPPDSREHSWSLLQLTLLWRESLHTD